MIQSVLDLSDSVGDMGFVDSPGIQRTHIILFPGIGWISLNHTPLGEECLVSFILVSPTLRIVHGKESIQLYRMNE